MNQEDINDDQIAAWWRRVGTVTPNLAVSGDLPPGAFEARTKLDEWVAHGVTAILDVRQEWSDEHLVRGLAPDIHYVHLGTDDNGTERDRRWFDAGVAAARRVLDDERESKLLVHCHMGINRGPSMALAILLDQGWDLIEALDAIRAARPIAAVLYARDAVRWHHRRSGTDDAMVRRDLRRLARWQRNNGIDASRVIRLIRRAEMQERSDLAS